MEVPYESLFRIVIIGIFISSSSAQNNVVPPLPYLQNNREAIAFATWIAQQLSNPVQPSYYEPYSYDYDYLLPQNEGQDSYYYPYDYNQNQESYSYYAPYGQNYDYQYPIQIIPSRLPPPLEKLIESIQNFFSTYNYPELQNVPYSPTTTIVSPTTMMTTKELPSPEVTLKPTTDSTDQPKITTFPPNHLNVPHTQNNANAGKTKDSKKQANTITNVTKAPTTEGSLATSETTFEKTTMSDSPDATTTEISLMTSAV